MNATSRLVAALAALALSLPASARAQGCIGAPVPDRARAVQVQGGVSTVDVGRDFDSTDFGAAFRGNPAGPLAYSVQYLLRTVGDNDTRVHDIVGELAYRIPLPVNLLTVCARSGVGAAFLSDDDSESSYANFTVPLALVVEYPVPLAVGRTLSPYVAPQLLWSSTSGHVFGFDLDESDVGFGVDLGVGLRVNRFLLGVGSMFTNLEPALGTPAFLDRAFYVRAGVLF